MFSITIKKNTENCHIQNLPHCPFKLPLYQLNLPRATPQKVLHRDEQLDYIQ